MAFSAALVATLELQLLHTVAIDVYDELLRLMNLALFLMLNSMFWFVYLVFGVARRWLALLITVAWGIGRALHGRLKIPVSVVRFRPWPP